CRLLVSSCRLGICKARARPHLLGSQWKERSMSSENLVHTSDATFEQDVLKSDLPVLVDFWAEWCGPCKMIGPILDEFSTSYAGRLKIVKLNVDENGATPAKFNIRVLTTL